MRRLTRSGLMFALVSGLSSCSSGPVLDRQANAATGGGSTSSSTATGNSATSTNRVTMMPTGSAELLADAGAGGASTRPARVLLYSFSTLNIPSVPAQLALLEQKLRQWQFEVDRSVDPAVFSERNLAKYAAVGMIN